MYIKTMYYNGILEGGDIVASKKVTITMDDKLLNRLDRYCYEMGTNRSSLIAVIMGQYLAQMEKTQSVLSEAVSNLVAQEVAKK